MLNRVRLDLQILRAFSIIFVFCYHLNHSTFFPSGFIGVDIFFVLSGYLVGGSLIKNFFDDNQSSIIEFVGRRIKRLFLPSLACLLMIFLCLYFFPLDRKIANAGINLFNKTIIFNCFS